MPLIMCPNCQTEMKEINRQGVMLDMCAKCHGVWLDRGELNKLLEINQQELAETAVPSPDQAQPAPPRYDEYRAGHHSSKGPRSPYRSKSKLQSLFDMFD